jgi:hypothetical protein
MIVSFKAHPPPLIVTPVPAGPMAGLRVKPDWTKKLAEFWTLLLSVTVRSWLPKNKAGTLKEQLKKPWLSVEQGTIKGTSIPVVSPENHRIVTDEFGVMKPDGLRVMVSP